MRWLVVLHGLPIERDMKLNFWYLKILITPFFEFVDVKPMLPKLLSVFLIKGVIGKL